MEQHRAHVGQTSSMAHSLSSSISGHCNLSCRWRCLASFQAIIQAAPESLCGAEGARRVFGRYSARACLCPRQSAASRLPSQPLRTRRGLHFAARPSVVATIVGRANCSRSAPAHGRVQFRDSQASPTWRSSRNAAQHQSLSYTLARGIDVCAPVMHSAPCAKV